MASLDVVRVGSAAREARQEAYEVVVIGRRLPTRPDAIPSAGEMQDVTRSATGALHSSLRWYATAPSRVAPVVGQQQPPTDSIGGWFVAA